MTTLTAVPVTTSKPMAPLTERALLVDLSIHEWPATRLDRQVTEAVTRDHGADKKSGRFTKSLVPRQYLAKIRKVSTKAREVHHRLTLPWSQSGLRILPVDLHLSYTDELRVLRIEFGQAVEEFIAVYDKAKAAARLSLGTLYREDDYPDVHTLRRAYAMEVQPQPLPDGHDWRIDLPEDAVDRIIKSLEERLEEAQRLATADLYRRLAGVVSHMAETLAVPDKIFRDSLVGNCRALCNLLPSLNIARDPALDQLRGEIEARLASLDPDSLRTVPQTRDAAAVDAAALLDTINARLASYTGQAA